MIPKAKEKSFKYKLTATYNERGEEDHQQAAAAATTTKEYWRKIIASISVHQCSGPYSFFFFVRLLLLFFYIFWERKKSSFHVVQNAHTKRAMKLMVLRCYERKESVGEWARDRGGKKIAVALTSSCYMNWFKGWNIKKNIFILLLIFCVPFSLTLAWCFCTTTTKKKLCRIQIDCYKYMQKYAALLFIFLKYSTRWP